MPTPSITGSTIGRNGAGGTTLTINHASDGNPLYYFGERQTDTILTSVTFDGVPMIPLQSISGTIGAFGYGYDIYFLPSPGTVTANGVVTGASSQMCGIFLNIQNSYYGAFRGLVVTIGTGTSILVNQLYNSINSIVISFPSTATNNTVFTAAGSQTLVAALDSLADTQLKGACTSIVGTGSSISMGATQSVSGSWACGAFALEYTIASPISGTESSYGYFG